MVQLLQGRRKRGLPPANANEEGIDPATVLGFKMHGIDVHFQQRPGADAIKVGLDIGTMMLSDADVIHQETQFPMVLKSTNSGTKMVPFVQLEFETNPLSKVCFARL